MGRFKPFSTDRVKERAILVGVDLGRGEWSIDDSLEELGRLAETDGAEVVFTMTQKLDSPKPRTFIGSGKVEELKGLVDRLSADVVIFDDELSPSQQSNLERALGEPTKVIDRTALILDIFGIHACTHEGRLQVQLAQLQYLYPRLRGMWSHLVGEQTRGGIGSRFGQGESQLEVDRRLIRSRISWLRGELKELEKRRRVQTKARYDSGIFRIALVGYTNAGKSTLLNALTGAGVYAQDELFATLDPTTRSMNLLDGRRTTISDTVGFIQKLPTNLVEAFKSTLSEVVEANLILLVVDAADPHRTQQINVVQGILKDIGADGINSVLVLNKGDLIDNEVMSLIELEHPGSVPISAKSGFGLDGLRYRISDEISRDEVLLTVLIPYKEGGLAKRLHDTCAVLREEYVAEGLSMTLKAPTHVATQLSSYVVEDGSSA